jgi:hypothetical protein
MTHGDWRCVVKVRTLDVSRVFSGLTHHTEDGAGGLKLRLHDKVKVSTETLLILDVLACECGAELEAKGIIDLNNVHHEQSASVTAPVYDPEDILGVFFRLPPPPLPVTCEFDMGMSARQYARGRFLNVIFWMMGYTIARTFSLEITAWPGWDNRKRCVSNPGIFEAANDLWDTIFGDVADVA